MKLSLPKSLLLSGLFVSLAVCTHATSATLNALDDAGIRSGSSTTNYGSAVNAYLGNTGISISAPARIVLAFDLASLPDNAVIDSVSLVISNRAPLTGTTSITAELHELTTTFVEGQVTWSISSTGNSWATAGGDFSSTVLATASVNPQGTLGTENTWSSSLLTDLIQAKATSNSIAYLIIKAADESLLNNYANLQTTEGPSSGGGYASVPGPQLLISYSIAPVPEPATAALILGLCGLGLATATRRFRGKNTTTTRDS